MTRVAILLSTLHENPVHSQTASMRSFLLSSLGGGWCDSEVIDVQTDDWSDLNKAIRAAKEADYAFVFVVGPGDRVKGAAPWPEVEFVLSNGTVTERNLNPGTSRCALVLDLQVTPSKQSKELAACSAGASSQIRRAFYASLNAAEKGVITLCRPQAAPIPFADLLIQTAIDWAEDNSGVLDFASLNTLLTAKSSGQVIYRGGRRRCHFPFAVSMR